MSDIVELAKAYFSNHQVRVDEITNVLEQLKKGLETPAETEEKVDEIKPAVPVEDSIHEDYLVCLEDGEKVVMLRRYLNQQYGMSLETYREKWGLPDDYPAVPANYSKKRSSLAKKQGLGKK